MCDGDRVITSRNIEESEYTVGARARLACAANSYRASRRGALPQFNLRAGNRARILIADDALDGRGTWRLTGNALRECRIRSQQYQQND